MRKGVFKRSESLRVKLLRRKVNIKEAREAEALKQSEENFNRFTSARRPVNKSRFNIWCLKKVEHSLLEESYEAPAKTELERIKEEDEYDQGCKADCGTFLVKQMSTNLKRKFGSEKSNTKTQIKRSKPVKEKPGKYNRLYV